MGVPKDKKLHEIMSRKMLPTLSKYTDNFEMPPEKKIASASAWRHHRTSLFPYLYNENHNYTVSCWKIFLNHWPVETNWKEIEIGEGGMQSCVQAKDNFLLWKSIIFFSR